MNERIRADVKLVLCFPGAPDEEQQSGTIATWQPSDPSMFGVRLSILAGTIEAESTDAFDVLRCTPAWFAAHWADVLAGWREELGGDVVPGRGFWFVSRWDRAAFDRWLELIVDVAAAGNWPEVANRLGRFAPWEYDYRYDADQDKSSNLEPMDWEAFWQDHGTVAK